MKPTIGRTVLYVLPSHHRNAGQIRPAVIVQNWGAGEDTPALNLRVHTDPANDEPLGNTDACSVSYSEGKEPRTWHWPERV